jgi:AcrR family transcriptional regulator
VSSLRARLLGETRRLIGEKGAAISMSDVAAATGVSRQAVYLHFPSRGRLFLGLVRQMDDETQIRPRLATALEADDPVEALREFLATWLRFAATIQPVATVLLATRTSDADAWAAWDDRMTELRGGHLHAARRLADAGLLRDGLDPRRAADLTWALTSVQVWEQLRLDRAWAARRVERELVDAVVAAVVVSND